MGVRGAWRSAVCAGGAVAASRPFAAGQAVPRRMAPNVQSITAYSSAPMSRSMSRSPRWRPAGAKPWPRGYFLPAEIEGLRCVGGLCQGEVHLGEFQAPLGPGIGLVVGFGFLEELLGRVVVFWAAHLDVHLALRRSVSGTGVNTALVRPVN
jgi:hypothetical protein